MRAGGRGLLIVSALVDHIEAEHDVTDGCTVVRARRDLASVDQHHEPDPAGIADLGSELHI